MTAGGAKYLSGEASLKALRSMPLESAFRGVPFDRLVSRLATERSLFAGGHVRSDPARPWLVAVVVVERQPDDGLRETLASIALQSCPDVACILVPLDGSVTEKRIGDFLAHCPLRPRVTEILPDLDGANRARIRRANYCCFLRHADRLHPSAAAWLAIESSAGREAEVVAWGELQSEASGGQLAWAQRNPACHREALLHFPYLRNAFAVSSKQAGAYAGDLVRELVKNDLHLFQIWLSRRANIRWGAHPEYFLVRAVERAAETPEKTARRTFDEYADTYAKLFATMSKEFRYAQLAHDSPAPYRLVPVRRPDSLSVIIPFRDKPELTLRAVASIARQDFAQYLEVLLINNQSSPASIARIRRETERLSHRLTVRIVDFDKPFNHSEQCNVGVLASIGEVIVFLNNDCEILSSTALSEMAAWAMQPDVASVGVAIYDPGSSSPSGGMDARLAPVNYFDSVVEEKTAPNLSPFVRRSFGNTFAFCALRREVFDALGGLDAKRFPNGYNDVDFASRARMSGLHHLVLGHLGAQHSPGKSRSKTDESAQKILIRTLYPAVAAAALESIAMDEILVRLSKTNPVNTREPVSVSSREKQPVPDSSARSIWARARALPARVSELIRSGHFFERVYGRARRALRTRRPTD